MHWIQLQYFSIFFLFLLLIKKSPEGTQVIVGSINMGYISDTARNRTHNLFRTKAGADTTRPQCQIYARDSPDRSSDLLTRFSDCVELDGFESPETQSFENRDHLAGICWTASALPDDSSVHRRSMDYAIIASPQLGRDHRRGSNPE